MEQRRISFWKRLYDELTSMKFAIIVLLILASVSIFAILFQNYHPINFHNWQQYYASKLGPFKFRLYSFLQLFTPYHSWWFISLLVVLCSSLLLCSINRLRIILKIVFIRNDFRSEGELSKWNNGCSFKIPAGSDLSGIRRTLKRKFFSVYTREEPERTYIFAKKNDVSRFGPFLSHIGLLSLFIGGLMASIYGRSTIRWAVPGDYIHMPSANHKVLVDDFKIIYNESGQIKDYISSVRVFDDKDSLIMKKEIEVNHPLRYQGLNYYQSSYRLHSRKLKEASFVIRDTSGTILDTLALGFGERTKVAGTDYSVELSDFAADFQITEQGIISKSDRLRNPAILLDYYKDDQEVDHQWIFSNFPSIHENRNHPLKAELLGMQPLYYTGLEVTSMPGSAFIWAGFIIMTLGLILVFYLNHKIVWATIVHRESGDWEIFLAGASQKFKGQFKKEMEDIIAGIKRITLTNSKHKTAGSKQATTG